MILPYIKSKCCAAHVVASKQTPPICVKCGEYCVQVSAPEIKPPNMKKVADRLFGK